MTNLAAATVFSSSLFWMLLLLFPSSATAAGTHRQRPEQVPRPEDYLVQGLADIEPAFAPFQGKMYAGLVPTTLYGQESSSSSSSSGSDEPGNLMFWLFAPDQPVYDDSLVIWNNGGPGCSSMSGALFENSPVTIKRYPAGFFGIDPTVPLEYNPFAWTNATMMMYVEHPHETGFTSGPFPRNETEVGRDFYYFLQNLFTIFDGAGHGMDLREKRLSFFGESYAGQLDAILDASLCTL